MSRCRPPLLCLRSQLRYALLVLGLCAGPTCHAANPAGGSGTVVLEPAPATSPPRTLRRVVFTCISTEVTVFSDRPCGPLPQLHELRLLDPGAGRTGASASVRAPAPSASTRAVSRAGETERSEGLPDIDAAGVRVETCQRLEAAVRTLDGRMRAGYTAREAARLWARWREAKSRLREADC